MAMAAAAVGVVSSVVSMMAARNQAEYQAQVARNEAIVAEENRQRSIFESQVEAVDADQAASQELGLLMAEAGASGLGITGSKKLEIQSKEALAGRDRARIRHAGDVEGANFGREADAARAEAKNAKRAKSAATVSGFLDVGSSLISGASKTGKLGSKVGSTTLNRTGG